MWLSTSIKHRGDNLVARWQARITFASPLLPRSNAAILFHQDSHFFADFCRQGGYFAALRLSNRWHSDSELAKK
jgi:hypothetical protein